MHQLVIETCIMFSKLLICELTFFCLYFIANSMSLSFMDPMLGAFSESCFKITSSS